MTRDFTERVSALLYIFNRINRTAHDSFDFQKSFDLPRASEKNARCSVLP